MMARTRCSIFRRRPGGLLPRVPVPGPTQPARISLTLPAAPPIASQRSAVDISAVEILAPSSSTAKPQIPPTPLELRVGKLVALAASALAASVHHYANGNPTRASNLRVANLVAQLFELRCLMVGAWDFDGIAHQYGRLALVEAYSPSNDAERRVVDELVNGTMEILRKVVLSERH